MTKLYVNGVCCQEFFMKITTFSGHQPNAQCGNAQLMCNIMKNHFNQFESGGKRNIDAAHEKARGDFASLSDF